MHITIKNVKAVSVNASTKSENVNVEMDGVALEELLCNIDIMAVIQYYGVAELLDSMGGDQLKAYLECI